MATVSIKKKANKLIKSWMKLTKDYDKAVALALWEAEYNCHTAKCKVKALAVVIYLRELVSNENLKNEKMYYTSSTSIPSFSSFSSTDSQGSLP